MTVLEIPIAMFAACAGIVFIGAIVQGTLGIGLGLVSAPVLALADPAFIPVAILVAILPLTVSMSVRERAGIDRRGVGFAMLGRIPGAVLGTVAVVLTGTRFLVVLVAISVLAAVAASITSVRFATTGRSLVVAGAVSGFMGTATGIGGPPMAITYQHADPAVMRSTVSVFFTLGSAISLGMLGLAGVIGERQLLLGAALIPAVVAGFALSGPITRRLDADRIRMLVLAVCAASAITLLTREFL
jgi:uncharacterized membrane protein YfcA